VAASTNVCTGSSTKLPQVQCNAWGDFYDALAGGGWTKCAGSRADPCSCNGDEGGGGKAPVCGSDNTTVIQMCVAMCCCP
jgi:hypothetical protein